MARTEGDLPMSAHGKMLDPHANDVATGAWRLDPPRSSVEFHAPQFWGLATVKGHFESYQGTLDLGADPAIELTIDATSLETGQPQARSAPAVSRFLRMSSATRTCGSSPSPRRSTATP
jgi:polyisoprenoid-binding protein YceI